MIHAPEEEEFEMLIEIYFFCISLVLVLLSFLLAEQHLLKMPSIEF